VALRFRGSLGQVLVEDEVLQAFDEAHALGVAEFVAARLQAEHELRGARALGVGAVDGVRAGDAIVDAGVVSSAVDQHRVLALVRSLDARRQWACGRLFMFPLRRRCSRRVVRLTCLSNSCSRIHMMQLHIDLRQNYCNVQTSFFNDFHFVNRHCEAVVNVRLTEHVNGQLAIVALGGNTQRQSFRALKQLKYSIRRLFNCGSPFQWDCAESSICSQQLLE
jgi:hypothetical protein